MNKQGLRLLVLLAYASLILITMIIIEPAMWPIVVALVVLLVLHGILGSVD